MKKKPDQPSASVLDELCRFLKENNMSFVFWVCPKGCNGGVTWNKDKTDARCDVCGIFRSSNE